MIVSVALPIALNKCFDYNAPDDIATKLQCGMRVKVPFGKAEQTGFVVKLNSVPNLPPNIKLKSIKNILDSRVFYGPDLMETAAYISHTYANTLGETLNVLIPSFINDKLLSKYGEPKTDLPLFYSAGPLTAAQKNALSDFETKEPLLLCGPAASGKTEVTLQYAHKVLSSGGQALILVPDAVSSSGLIKTIQSKFGDANIHLWHSKIPLSKRKTAAAEILSGRPCIVVGTRSACLLPFTNLKLAVITQEEDKTYKQEDAKPYYHAREVLAHRCKLNKAKFIMISAAPSFETLKAAQDGNIKTQVFDKQIKGYDFKPVILLAPKNGQKSKFFSDGLIEAVHQNMLSGKQSLIIFNRLGFSGAYACLNCRTFAKCKSCGGILSRQQQNGQDILICRKCGKRESLEQTCPACGNSIFRSFGGGTQALESEAARLFPQARIYRFDSQTLKLKDGQGHFVQEAVDTHNADIIIGTHLALKLDFKDNITLAAFPDIDMELNSPDFRTAERFAQTLLNLKGRLGRAKDSKLILQMSKNDVFDLSFLKTGDYRAFAETELAFRKEFNFPPYTKLVKIIVSAKSKAALEKHTKTITDAITTAYSAFMQVAGTAHCGKTADEFYQQYILIKSLDDDMLRGFLKNLFENKAPKQITLKIMADPYNFI